MWQGVAWCLLIAVLYVSCLYLKSTPASRQHPDTVKWRILSVILASSVSWLPALIRYKQTLQGAGLTADQFTAAPVLSQLLGLQLQASLLSHTVLALLLTAVLFAGPLLYIAVTAREGSEQAHCRSNRGPNLHTVRDCMIAPLTEEWCFRACMVPLLWLEGLRPRNIIILAPLFFGPCHLHHARELIIYKQWPATQVIPLVCFQLLYTTAFGWFATWVFLFSGNLAPSVAVHAFCNYMGVPPFQKMASHQHSRLLMAATFTGVTAFCFMLNRVAHTGYNYCC